MAFRFAMQAAPKIAKYLKLLAPTSKLEAGFRFGPDLLYAASSAALAPEGTSKEDRAKLAAEDLAIGLGASVLGQLAGGGIARKMIGKRFAAMSPEERKKLGMAMTVGDAMAGPLNMIAPRPVMEDIYRQAAVEAQDLQAIEAQSAIQEREQALLQALINSGLLLK